VRWKGVGRVGINDSHILRLLVGLWKAFGIDILGLYSCRRSCWLDLGFGLMLWRGGKRQRKLEWVLGNAS
jgi:hypothetical protein